MSRIGKMPVIIPDGVKVNIAGQDIGVEGVKGKLVREIHNLINVKIEDGKIVLGKNQESKLANSLYGLSRVLINNMVVGASKGYEKILQITGVGYRAQVAGKKLTVNLGYSHPIVYEAPEGITFEVPAPNQIKVMGIDKELVGQVAANVRKFRGPEPYKGKGIRYENEYVRRKAGKTGAGAK
ncbi:50S ribosomal protein L6 [bacterium]|nr:50S ribosomal protein L6 [bacterium]MBU1614999.1 50S ribosomal protein L6 [bacterium]